MSRRATMHPLRVLRVAALLGAALLMSRVRATNLPPGFAETVVATGGQLSSLRAIAFAPDGDLFIAAGYGWMWVLRNGALTKIAELPLYTYGEAGLCDITIDPDYATNHALWISYTPTQTTMRVSRFTYSGGHLVSEAAVAEWVESGPFHLGGSLRFAADKTLFISTGDNELRSTTSQNPHDLRGKILHINRDGSPAAGNPYLDGVAGDPRVWAIGFRNPFRMSFQPHADNLFIGDVGDGDWEEVSIGVAGGNFGWANIEGPAPAGQPGYVYPIYSYPHSDPRGSAITGGAHVRGGDFAPEYEGDYFFGDSSRGHIFRMRLDGLNQPLSTDLWATDAAVPVSMVFGPDGALYYASYLPASVRKISYVGGSNRQPVAEATVSPDSGNAPLATVLDGSASSDPDNDALSYQWDFGDGTNAAGSIASHNYPAGVYQARLIVEDAHGASDHTPDIRIVSGNRAPSATVSAPADESTYVAGQNITYSGFGVDPENGNLPCARFSWSVLFRHLEHVHPYIGPIEGTCSGSFTTADTGETSVDTHYEIRLTVQDDGDPIGSAGALTGTRSVEIRPIVTSMVLATQPRSDLQLTLDTQAFAAPLTVDGVLNFKRIVGVVEPQLASDGHTYRWLSWSDGGAREHEIRLTADSGFRTVSPPTSQSLSATFGCDVIQEVPGLQIDDAMGVDTVTLHWDAVSDPCLATGPTHYRVYASAGARPAQGSGAFPLDPSFVAVGETAGTTFTYTPAPDARYFMVVALGTDGLFGRVGHYGR